MEKVRMHLIIMFLFCGSSCATRIDYNAVMSNGYSIAMSEIIRSYDSIPCLGIDKEVFPFHYTSGNKEMDSIIVANGVNIYELLDDPSLTLNENTSIKITKQQCASDYRIKFSHIKDSFFCAIIYKSPIELSFNSLYGSFTYIQFHVKENSNIVDIHYLSEIHIEP